MALAHDPEIAMPVGDQTEKGTATPVACDADGARSKKRYSLIIALGVVALLLGVGAVVATTVVATTKTDVPASATHSSHPIPKELASAMAASYSVDMDLLDAGQKRVEAVIDESDERTMWHMVSAQQDEKGDATCAHVVYSAGVRYAFKSSGTCSFAPSNVTDCLSGHKVAPVNWMFTRKGNEAVLYDGKDMLKLVNRTALALVPSPFAPPLFCELQSAPPTSPVAAQHHASLRADVLSIAADRATAPEAVIACIAEAGLDAVYALVDGLKQALVNYFVKPLTTGMCNVIQTHVLQELQRSGKICIAPSGVGDCDILPLVNQPKQRIEALSRSSLLDVHAKVDLKFCAQVKKVSIDCNALGNYLSAEVSKWMTQTLQAPIDNAKNKLRALWGSCDQQLRWMNPVNWFGRRLGASGEMEEEEEEEELTILDEVLYTALVDVHEAAMEDVNQHRRKLGEGADMSEEHLLEMKKAAVLARAIERSKQILTHMLVDKLTKELSTESPSEADEREEDVPLLANATSSARQLSGLSNIDRIRLENDPLRYGSISNTQSRMKLSRVELEFSMEASTEVTATATTAIDERRETDLFAVQGKPFRPLDLDLMVPVFPGLLAVGFEANVELNMPFAIHATMSAGGTATALVAVTKTYNLVIDDRSGTKWTPVRDSAPTTQFDRGAGATASLSASMGFRVSINLKVEAIIASIITIFAEASARWEAMTGMDAAACLTTGSNDFMCSHLHTRLTEYIEYSADEANAISNGGVQLGGWLYVTYPQVAVRAGFKTPANAFLDRCGVPTEVSWTSQFGASTYSNGEPHPLGGYIVHLAKAVQLALPTPNQIALPTSSRQLPELEMRPAVEAFWGNRGYGADNVGSYATPHAGFQFQIWGSHFTWNGYRSTSSWPWFAYTPKMHSVSSEGIRGDNQVLFGMPAQTGIMSDGVAAIRFSRAASSVTVRMGTTAAGSSFHSNHDAYFHSENGHMWTGSTFNAANSQTLSVPSSARYLMVQTASANHFVISMQINYAPPSPPPPLSPSPSGPRMRVDTTPFASILSGTSALGSITASGQSFKDPSSTSLIATGTYYGTTSGDVGMHPSWGFANAPLVNVATVQLNWQCTRFTGTGRIRSVSGGSSDGVTFSLWSDAIGYTQSIYLAGPGDKAFDFKLGSSDQVVYLSVDANANSDYDWFEIVNGWLTCTLGSSHISPPPPPPTPPPAVAASAPSPPPASTLPVVPPGGVGLIHVPVHREPFVYSVSPSASPSAPTSYTKRGHRQCYPKNGGHPHIFTNTNPTQCAAKCDADASCDAYSIVSNTHRSTDYVSTWCIVSTAGCDEKADVQWDTYVKMTGLVG